MKEFNAKKRGFTLIELLVVISIIGILAGLLLPALARAKNSAKVAQARTEIKGIETAIKQYQSTYSHLPAAKKTRTEGLTTYNPDFTYGTWSTVVTNQLVYQPKGVKIATSIPASPMKVNANNSEVMAILMNIKEWTPARPKGNPDNPQSLEFLNAKFVNDTKSPGVGQDGVYRDPWGSPYIITLDLSYDNMSRDAFYRGDTVSQDLSTKRGFNGLISAGQKDTMECKADVMVWSLGPDRIADPSKNALSGANKDNILSWQ